MADSNHSDSTDIVKPMNPDAFDPDVADSLAFFDLTGDEDAETVKEVVRTAKQENHPDVGGNRDYFATLTKHEVVLKKHDFL